LFPYCLPVWRRPKLPPSSRAKAATKFAAHKATVFLFLYTDCPIANGYAPEMARIVEKYRKEGVAFFRVYPAPDITQEKALKHGQEYSLPFDAVLDGELVAREADGGARGAHRSCLRHNLAPADTSVVSTTATPSSASRAPAPRRRNCATRLDAVLAGKEVSTKETQALGCFLPEPKDTGAAPAGEQK
jgi:hypothetical protein